MATFGIKLKKISKGYYSGTYKNVDFTICRVGHLPKNEIAWYWQIGNQEVNDWYTTKEVAIFAAIDHIKQLNQ